MARSFKYLWTVPLALAMYVFVAMFPVSQLAQGTENRLGSVVKVSLKGGHGSGVYIGGGRILTAAHVVNGESGVVKVIASDGTEKFATVAWLNNDHDVALLRLRGDVPETFIESALSCATPEVGDPVTAYGSPGPYDFLVMRGFVSGPPSVKSKWKSVISVDLTILPGMSGGPVYDSHGNVAGISVGVAVFHGGIVRIGFVVPGSTICKLMV